MGVDGVDGPTTTTEEGLASMTRGPENKKQKFIYAELHEHVRGPCLLFLKEYDHSRTMVTQPAKMAP